MKMQEFDPDRVLECFVELNTLSKLPRIGWLLAGVSNPESVAEHCFETALFAFVLSKFINSNEKLDIGKVLLMALFHEIGEVRLTDLPRRSKNYIGKAKNHAEREAAKDVLDGVADDVIGIIDELHNMSSVEARLVEAAEELQIIFKALIYAKENNGDMSEYRNDVMKYDPQGFECAEEMARVIKEKLDNYLNGKEYWATGYRQKQPNDL